MLIEFLIDALVRGFIEHIRADINAMDLFESLLGEIFSDQACTTCQIKNFKCSDVFFSFLSELGHIVGNVLRIWISTSQVHALVVRGQEVEVLRCHALLIFVAGEVHRFVLISKLWNVPIELVGWNEIPISLYR